MRRAFVAICFLIVTALVWLIVCGSGKSWSRGHSDGTGAALYFL